MRLRTLGITLAVMIVLLAACDDDPPVDATGAPRPPAMLTGVPATAAQDSSWFDSLHDPGDTAEVPAAPVHGRWEQVDAATPVEEWPPFRLYHRATDTLWAVRDEENRSYWLLPLPYTDQHTDQLIATTEGLIGDGQETVLVDLTSGEVAQLLPFAVRPYNLDTTTEGQMEFELAQPVGAAMANSLPGGRYRYDLATRVLTYLDRTSLGPRSIIRYELAQPLPDSSYWPGATRAELQLDADRGMYALSFVNEQTGESRQMEAAMHSAVRSPNGRWLAYITATSELRLLELGGVGDTLVLGPPANWGYPTWSPDSGHVASGYQLFDGHDSVFWKLPDELTQEILATRTLPRIGPIDDAAFAGWRRDAPEALLLGDYCLPGGIHLDRLDLETGMVIRIPTAVTGFWSHEWSPDGSAIAVAAPELPAGLLDPVSGALLAAPTLTLIETLQSYRWSASGEWLLLSDIPGRDRCLG